MESCRVLFDDGKVASEVKEVHAPEIVITISVGGKLTSNKGMNLPGSPLSLPGCTDKDLLDLKLYTFMIIARKLMDSHKIPSEEILEQSVQDI